MSRFKIAVVLLFVLVLAGSGAVLAQSQRVVEAKIPFDFVVNKELLPSGDYEITVLANGLVRIQGSDGGAAAAAFSTPLRDEAPSGNGLGQLVFNQVEGEYCLAQVWGRGGLSSGREMLKPRGDKNRAVVDAGELVAVNVTATSGS